MKVKSDIIFEFVRPVFLDKLWKFLKESNPLYGNIVVKTENTAIFHSQMHLIVRPSETFMIAL